MTSNSLNNRKQIGMENEERTHGLDIQDQDFERNLELSAMELIVRYTGRKATNSCECSFC